jgi:hypothetical protein
MRELGLILLIPIGAFVALAGWVTAGVTVAVIGFVATIAIHLVNGIVGYRRAMDHEWPPVEPSDDEDW